MGRRLTTACSRRPSQSSNLHAQICRLSGARLMLAVRRQAPVSRSDVLVFASRSIGRRGSSEGCACDGRSSGRFRASHLPSHCHVWSRQSSGQAASVFARHRERSNPSLLSRSIRSRLRSSAVFEVCVGLLCGRVAVRLRSGVVSGWSMLRGHFVLVFIAPPNNCMQPTPQPVIKFAYANLLPAWCAADAGC